MGERGVGRSLALSAAAAVFAAAGCGYSLAGRGSYLPADIREVAIPAIVNRTPYVGVDQLITQKVREEFIGRGKFTLQNDTEQADAVLDAEIVGFSLAPAGLTERQLASRYRLTVTIRARFTDRTEPAKPEVLWSNDALTFTDEYELAVTGDVEAASFVDQQRPTLERVAADVARTLVTSITEAF